MRGTAKNALGKIEKNARVKEGDCIFPFKYKRQEHLSCIASEKGDICATEVNPKTNTLIKYGYCHDDLLKSTRKESESKDENIKLIEVDKGILVSEEKLHKLCRSIQHSTPPIEKLKIKSSKTLKSTKKMKY